MQTMPCQAIHVLTEENRRFLALFPHHVYNVYMCPQLLPLLLQREPPTALGVPPWSSGRPALTKKKKKKKKMMMMMMKKYQTSSFSSSQCRLPPSSLSFVVLVGANYT
jgi:hypothetical protein